MLTNNWLKALRNRLASGSGTSLRRRRGKTGTKVQPLEQRSLLAATPVGPEFRVNTSTFGIQGAYAGLPHSMATDANGNFVVTWNSNPEDGNLGFGIYAQRYNHSGMPQGGEFRVNSYTTDSQLSPSVAMDADGDFIIAWSSKGQDGSDYGIYAKRFNAAGVAQGGEFLVNTFTTGSQSQPAVAMDANGDFLVSWSSSGQDGSLSGIYAQRYNASGLAQGNEFKVNTYTTSNQQHPSVAINPDGEFVISWSSDGQDGGNFGIYAQRYNAAGLTQGDEFRVNSYTTSQQLYPDVAMDSSGSFIIAWNGIGLGDTSSGIYAQLFDSAGNTRGGEFRASTQTGNYKDLASVEMDSDGDFVISWNSSNQDGSSYGVYAQRYAASGVRLGREFRVNTYTTDQQWFSALAMDADGDFIISWTSAWQDGSSDGVFAQRYRVSPTIADVLAAGDTLNSNERLVSQTTNLTVAFSENMAATGAGSVTNLANWGLTRNGVLADSQLQSVSFGLNATTSQYEAVVTFAAALVPGDYVLTAKDTMTDANGRQLDGDANGTDGGDFTRAFKVRSIGKSGPEFRVNTFTTGRQGTDQFAQQSVAMDDSGNYVVTWSSDGQDGSGYGVYAQRFNAAGVAQGDEFRVNTVTAGIQTYSAVAMDADGDFVITWTSNGVDGSNGAVVAQRYNALGLPQGPNFQVNVYFTNSQADSSVAMDADGDFVISWNSNGQNGNAYEVYARKYTAAGVALTGEFRVNTILAGQQHTSMTAMDADGDFVIVWSSFGQDLSSYGVYAQRYNAAGAAQGPEFRVNTRTTGIQRHPVVAMDADGDFVVSWDSDGQDGSSYGVFAQRFNAAGVAQGAEFQVSSFTANSQALPSIAMDDDGDFVVTWNSFQQDGSHYGVYAQRFNRTGVPQESEFRVNAFTANRQGFPAVAMDADGDYVVAWTSDGQDGSGYGMYAQRFGTNATTVLEVTAVGDSVTANEQLVSLTQSLTVAFSNAMSTAGTGSVTNLANWGLTRNGVDSSSLLQSVTFGFSSTTSRYEAVANFTTALLPGEYVLTAKDTMTNSNGFSLDGDANSVDGGDFTRAFQVQVIGGSGAEYRVNTFTNGSQQTDTISRQAVAVDANGNYVIAWASDGQDGNSYGIYAQRYNASGMTQGSEFRVNTVTSLSQDRPSVAMDADGDFVVTWTSNGQDGSTTGVYAQRYNALAAPVGVEFKVNTYTTSQQRYSTVAMDASGNFVISWSSFGKDGDGYGVYAQRYNSAGGVEGVEFKVNTYTTNSQSLSTVAMDADGDFVIAWQSHTQDGSGGGVYAQRYNSAGVAQGGEFKVNTYTAFGQQDSTIAMDASGDFVVTWSSNGQDGSDFGVYAQRFNALGVAQGGEFLVNSYTTGNQQFPTVAMDTDGDFVVTWTSDGQDGSSFGIYGQRYNRLGVAEGNEFRVSTYATNSQRYSSVSMDRDGDFVVAWNSNGQDGSGYGVYAQRFSADKTTVRDVLAVGDSVNQNEQLVSAPQSLTVAFSNNMSTTGTGSVTNLSNWGLTKNGVDASSTLQSVTFGFNSSTGQYEAVVSFTGALTLGDYVLTAKGTLTNINGFPLDGDANGTDGGDFARAFQVPNVGRLGSEFRVNTSTVGSQQTNGDLAPRAVAMDSHGNFVVTWYGDGSLDSSGYGIYAQRYNAAGVALGSEFLVNTYTTGFQAYPSVAMDADGDFVVTWSSQFQDGSGFGVYARRYNAAGAALSGEFQINTHTTNSQYHSTVAMDSDGDFVISWSSYEQDGSRDGVYARRYNNNGVAQGGAFQVNTYATSYQGGSVVAMDADGDFVITWSSTGQDLSGQGIYARRYNAAGTALSGEFQVNTFTTGNQRNSTIAMDADGDFVLTWMSDGQDGSGFGVYGRRYNSSGTALSGEFLVNSYTTNSQYESRVAMDVDGDFVVTWSGNGQDGNADGVFGRRYNAAGVAQGGEFQVNTYTTGNQYWSAVAMDADGDMVVMWTSNGQDGSGLGVYAQRFDVAAPLVQNVLTAGDPVTANEQLISAPTNMTIVFSDNMATAGAGSVTDLANWRLSRGGSDVSSEIQSVTFGFNSTTNRYEALVTFTAALTPGDYVLTARDTLSDFNGRQLDGDANGTDGGDFTRNFRVRQIAGVGGEFRVNTYTTSNQQTFAESPQSVAMDDAGNYVVTWSSAGQDGSGDGIYAQRYNAAGLEQGAEFKVNTYTINRQLYSSVAMDSDGDFVISWTSGAQDGSGYGIYAQRYNAAGETQGLEFEVNMYTTSNQLYSTVAMDADGDFVISWSSSDQDGSDFGIYAQRYNAAGEAQGLEFQVNSYITGSQRISTVAMDADGDFVISWSSSGQDGSGYGIYAQRYNAAGEAQGLEFEVNNYTTNRQMYSSVAMDSDGDFVISWTSSGQDGSGYGIYAQRYNAAGETQGLEFEVNSYTTINQQYSTVAMDADGDFVISWRSNGQDGASDGIYAQRFNATGAAQGLEFRVNSYTTGRQQNSTVAIDADGDFVISWSSNQDGSSYGVYAQRFGAVVSNATPVLALQAVVTSLPENTSTTGGIKVADIVVIDDGVGLNRLSLTGPQASLFEIVGNELRLRSGVVLDYEVLSSYSVNVVLDDELLGTVPEATEPYTLSLLNLREPGARVGSEFRVNTVTNNNQLFWLQGKQQTVAMDDTGNFVVIWSSRYQDGSGYGIYAQRYSALGAPQGNEFLVNTTTIDNQNFSTVAMDADGDFVVSWSSSGQDGSGDGVYAQRYNAMGVAQGAEFRVNSYTTSNQFDSTIAMDADGDFVVSWTSYGQEGSGSGTGIYAQRYNAMGVAQGAEFRVNSHTTNNQKSTTVAMDADGDFVVSWTSSAQDGSGSSDGIYAQRFNAAGVAQGGEFKVNSYTPSNQQSSTVAMDADGNFVVTWSSDGQDASGNGIYAQRYNAAGIAQGGEFKANSYTTNNQQYSAVAMVANGDFVISWTSSGQDGNSNGIYAQRYSSAGMVQGGEFRVNSYTSGSQRSPAVAMDVDGDFVISWTSNGQDGSGYGVYAQRFDAALPTVTLNVTSPTSDTTPDVVVSVTDTGAGILEGEPVVIDVDLNNDGDYADIGELNYALGTLSFGSATVTLPTLTDGTYRLRARAYDKADNEGTSSSQTLVISTNAAPANISLTGGTVAENQPTGTTVGQFSTTDPDSGNVFTYTLVPGLNGQPANAESFHSAISGNGRFLVFSSAADNLVPGDNNQRTDIFRRDLVTGEIVLVTTGPNGQSNSQAFEPSISDDGRFIAFSTNAFNLASGDTNGANDIYVKDMQTGTVTLVSTGVNGIGNGNSSNPAISGDGRYAAFESSASNLVTGDSNGAIDIFVKDLQTGTVTLVSTGANGQGSGFSQTPTISSDGRYVAFFSYASNLVTGDTNGRADVFVKDLQTGALTLVSVATTGQSNGFSFNPSISADGRFVAFHSDANNLVTGDTNGVYDVFVRDLQSGTTTLVSISGSTLSNGQSQNPAISSDGRYVAFESDGANLVAGDTNGTRDVFVKDLQSGTVTQISQAASGTSGNNLSYDAAISGDGARVVFTSSADNLVAGDTNAVSDVFVRNVSTTSIELGSVSPGDYVFFTMDGDVLKTRRPFNFEQKSSYSIRVRSTDQGGLWFEKDFTITVTNVNEFPLSTSLSNSSLDENAATATLVGLLSTIDPDSGNTFTYSFVDGGPWDADNSAFAIVGNELRTSRPLDFETQGSYLIRIRTVDQGGLEIQTEFTITVNDLVEDITAPTSLITALPAASTSLTLNIAVTGTDPGVGASGVLEYDLYYSTGGAFVLFETVPAGTPSTTFTGLPNTTYWFRSLARDNAGNVETKISADTYTRIGDIVPPSTQVTTAVPTSSGLFTVQMTGNKPSGTPITAFDVYVVIDSGEPILVGAASSVATGGGNYSGVILFQGILDGVSHTYRFFSRGRDGSGNVEAAPVSGDVSATYSFASAGLSATAIDVQNGVNQRSYVRYLDVLFSTSTGLSDLLAAGRVKVERFAINAGSVTPGNGTPVTGFGLVQNGNKLRLDFGSNGIGGLRQAGNGFYRVLLDLDGNGTFADASDKAFEFHRLFGDANGNGIVDVADTNLVTSQIGRVGANLDGDLDGNGSVNSTDRLYTTQQRGQQLLAPLLGWLDD
jgi:hypothetical protein